MTNLIDCKFEENLISRLEQISSELITPTLSDQSEEDVIILNFNTRRLNEELRNFRRLQNEMVKSKPISSSSKRKFKEKFVPSSISKDFTQAQIRTVQDLIDYTIKNSDTFRRSNLVSEDRILEELRELDPTRFMTFESEFPNIDLRLKSGPISAPEVDSLIKDNGLDPRRFSFEMEQNKRSSFNLLERFLSKLGIGANIMGSFCSLLDNIYAISSGQRDISGNPAEFLGNFQNVLGLINPDTAEVVGQVQELVQIFEDVQSKTLDVADGLQGAIGLLASAFGISMNFVNIIDKITGESDEEGSIEVQWDLNKILDAISNEDPRFLDNIEKTDKPLGDINQDGEITSADTDALQEYIDDEAADEVVTYIEDVFLPHLNKNASTFSEFVDFPSAENEDSNIGSLLESFSSVAEKFGAGPGSGDFGLESIIQAISIASGLISSIQSLASGSKPVNIEGLFDQLEQISQLSDSAREGLFSDFNEFSNDYKEEAEKALKEAEDNSVDNPSKTSEINQKNRESLEENYTEALESTADASKNLGGRVTENIERIRNGIRRLAAVGVLDQTAEQLLSVIDQSANQLQSKIKLFSPQSLDNGFHFNMGSSYAKMARQIATAQSAASDGTTKAMKDSVKGMMAQSAEKFQTKGKEEVEFVALRFCKLAGGIERMYDQVTKPLEVMSQEFQEVDRNLSGIGNETTLRAIEAGAIRYDTRVRMESTRDSFSSIDSTIAAPYINAAGERTITPSELNQSETNLPNMSSDYTGLPTYQDVFGRSWNGILQYTPGPRSTASNAGNLAGGWDNLERSTLSSLVSLARSWGSLLRIASAVRPVNDSGYHSVGKALDIYMDHNSQVDFLNLAYGYGFRGFGTYGAEAGGPFVHIDTRGGVSSWTGSGGRFNYYSLPGPNGAKIG